MLRFCHGRASIGEMKPATLVALCAVLASAAALADTFYRYRDQATGRDVFVDRLEQVPKRYRSQTKIVFESGSIENQDSAKRTAPLSPPDDGLAESPASHGRMASRTSGSRGVVA